MRVGQRIKSLFRRQPWTAEELAARAEAETLREQRSESEAVLKQELDSQRLVNSNSFTPPF